MPKTTKSGSARKSELPSTLQKSDAKAQRTFAKAHDAAAEEYGEGERAHRVAYSALKHSYEKVGDHWESKSQKVRRIRGRAAAARTPRATPPRRRRQCLKEAPHGSRSAPGYLGTVHDEQERTRFGHQEGQPPRLRA